MIAKKFKFYCATKDSISNVDLSFINLNKGDISIAYQNTESLSKVYNQFIEDAIHHKVDWMILHHDDIHIEVSDVCDRILATGYDVVGVAGTRKVDLKSPALWHVMGGGFEGGNLRGAVAHGSPEKLQMTGFGPYPDRCILIDGVFMAISRPVFEFIKFDETNPAKFHFYDLSYSLDCHNNGYKVGVGNIPIIHKSPGLREFTDEWRDGERWFLDKFNK